MLAAPRGVQFEITVSLAVVMITATGLLAAFFFATHAAQTKRLRPLLGRALVEEADRLGAMPHAVGSTGQWFIVERDGRTRDVSARGDEREPSLDVDGHWLAGQARREGRPLLSVGLPWAPIRFAAPIAGRTGIEIAVAILPPAVPRVAAFGLLLADGLAFTVLGAYLLRRRVVAPLHRLASAARSIGEGGPGARVHVEGIGEAVEVGRAFNEMSEALESRSGALEKAVTELRSVNRRLKRARDGLDRAERMAVVGNLAAGVAHEVGNPMGAVLAFVDLAQRDPALSEPARKYLSRAAEQGERVREILRQLLDFSRPPRAAYTPVDLAASAEQAIGLIQAQSRYRNVAFEIDVDPSAARVLADESLVAQILLNLVANGADAASPCEHPRVRLSVIPALMQVRSADGGRDSTGSAIRRASNDAVECRVEDSGPGVAPEDQQRIFDPFFTTKPPGEGTGLGLANALQLTKELGGALDLQQSGDLGGASFALKLPLASRPAEPHDGVRGNLGNRVR